MIVNGRFVHAEPGGFRRYASEVARRLDGATVVTPSRRWATGVRGRIWEQTALLRRARGEVLWSPATSGPLLHRRHVVTIHDVAPLADSEQVGSRFAALARITLPRLAAGAAAIVVDSEIMRDEVVERFEVRREAVTVVAPGVGDRFRTAADVARPAARRALGLEALGIDARRPLVGGLVSSIPRKRGADVLSVLDTLVAEGACEGVVAGFDGPAHVFGDRRRPTSARVCDLGALDDDRLATFLRALDVFVWLPEHEGFGLPVVEAAAAATAVVCTPVPAAVEHLAGSAVLVSEPAAASAAVRRLLEDPPMRHRAADRGRAQVTALTWDRTAAGVLAVVECVAGTRRRVRAGDTISDTTDHAMEGSP